MVLCITSEAEKIRMNFDASNIIKQAQEFKKAYKNPDSGVPKGDDFNWYILGRLDQLHQKIDNTNSHLSSLINKKVEWSTFWKILTVVISLLLIVIGAKTL